MAKVDIEHHEQLPPPLPEITATITLNREELVALRFIVNDSDRDSAYQRAINAGDNTGENPHFRNLDHFKKLVAHVSGELSSVSLKERL